MAVLEVLSCFCLQSPLPVLSICWHAGSATAIVYLLARRQRHRK
jgi:hypothetical protein